MKDMALKLWLNKIGEKHSNSDETAKEYEEVSNQYCEVIGISLDEIANEWENVENYSSEKKFKKKHQRLVSQYKIYLQERKYAKSVRSVRTSIIQSFYNSLPELIIDFDIPRYETEYHNRDITHDEVTKVINQSNPRERARFSMMAQAGLSPKNTILLKYKHIKKDFEANVVPCCVCVPKEICKKSHRNHFTFIGEESVEYLNQYFETRGIPKDDELIFLPIERLLHHLSKFGLRTNRFWKKNRVRCTFITA